MYKRQGNNIFGFGRSRARNLTDANRPTVTFDDVAGVEEAKLEPVSYTHLTLPTSDLV